jgi:hypothetical protein
MSIQNTLTPVASQAPAAGTGASLTLTGPTDGTRWKLKSVTGSYSATPATPTLTIAWGSVQEVYYLSLVAGVFQLNWLENGKVFPPNTTVTLTMSSGGGAVSSTMYPWAYTANA